MNSPLRDLAVVEYGASPKEIRVDYQSQYIIFGTGGFMGYAKTFLFQGPLIVVARKGTLDNPVFSKNDCWVIDTAYAVIPKDGVDAKWLYYQLANYDLKKLNEATAVPSINRDFLYSIKFSKPSFREQSKIARILSTCDSVIEKTQAAISKYKAIKQGMLQDLFTRGIDVETGKLRPRYEDAPELYKKSKLGWIPKEWEVEEIENIGEVISGATPSTLIKEYWDGKIIWITPADLSKQTDSIYFKQSSRKISEYGLQSCSASIIPLNSLVISSRAPIGYLSIVKEPFTTNQGCKSIRFYEKQIPEFYYYNLYLNIDRLKSFGAGTTFSEISKVDLELFLAVVCDEIEQKKISECLFTIDNKLQTEQTYLQKMQQLKKGLMEDLLSGRKKVRVEEDVAQKWEKVKADLQ